jgi:small subunit ribosomal protein S9
MIEKNITIAGKRKSAIAKAKIKQGNGKIYINKRPYENYDFFRKLMLEEPIEITKKILGDFNYDIFVNVNGGGTESQIQASRLAIARAILEQSNSPELKRAFVKYDKSLVVADTRRKEAYKPGDSKARRKRQKSFR